MLLFFMVYRLPRKDIILSTVSSDVTILSAVKSKAGNTVPPKVADVIVTSPY